MEEIIKEYRSVYEFFVLTENDIRSLDESYNIDPMLHALQELKIRLTEDNEVIETAFDLLGMDTKKITLLKEGSSESKEILIELIVRLSDVKPSKTNLSIGCMLFGAIYFDINKYVYKLATSILKGKGINQLEYFYTYEENIKFCNFKFITTVSGNMHIVDSKNNYVGIDVMNYSCEDFNVKIYLKDSICKKGRLFLDVENILEKYNTGSGYQDNKLYIPILDDLNDEVGYIIINNEHNGYYSHAVRTGTIKYVENKEYLL